ncbi:hypothetical protein BD324DRAFT_682390 [Kockovaella imperatae]|uniref:Uncharacterized protein n=1 Tax=Kockovaella imperatae TaxID=4999 RepID=A0A1Y1UDL8_9TREE|nr:hypothetical protein BD324DRAFT_682390 [Kockovaella imperatae]ORX35616.1 hypothetical protein BD324DRAFT_682390 [Kockovaella imperatae]
MSNLSQTGSNNEMILDTETDPNGLAVSDEEVENTASGNNVVQATMLDTLTRLSKPAHSVDEFDNLKTTIHTAFMTQHDTQYQQEGLRLKGQGCSLQESKSRAEELWVQILDSERFKDLSQNPSQWNCSEPLVIFRTEPNGSSGEVAGAVTLRLYHKSVPVKTLVLRERIPQMDVYDGSDIDELLGPPPRGYD